MSIRPALLVGVVALALAAPLAPARATDPVPPRPAAAEAAKFAADRAAILSMAGDYRVRFDMRETTPWRAGYQPLEPKTSGGYESVRVIEDTGRRIVLQHLLVVTVGGKSQVIKHWRQDWDYEPESVLVYRGQGRWEREAVPEPMRRGRWAQTVWQTDDSPRYGGWGEWTSEGGVLRWRSSWTWRPLARRDAIRTPPYDRYYAINRHSPTPTGWIHWQDNIKMGMVDGALVPFVQESVLNTYERFSGYDVAAADRYWAATQAYWASVRKAWDEQLRRTGAIVVAEEPDAGSITGPRLMGLADAIAEGRMPIEAASAEAARVIAAAAAGTPAALAQRTN
jgi:hypothetical protein